MADLRRINLEVTRFPDDTIEIDNSSLGFSIVSGNWRTSSAISGFVGDNYAFAGGGNKVATFSPNISHPGTFEVFVTWTSHPTRATNANLSIVHGNGTAEMTVDQSVGGGNFVSVGSYYFSGAQGEGVSWSTLATNGSVVADAVRFVPRNDTVELDNADLGFEVVSGVWRSSNSVAGFVGTDYRFARGGNKISRFTPNVLSAGLYQVFASWSADSNRATNARYDISHAEGVSTVYVDQSIGGIFDSLGVFQFDAGTSGSIDVRTLGADGFVVADAIRLVRALPSIIELDNLDDEFSITSGAWGTHASIDGFVGTNYRTARGGNKSARFIPRFLVGGEYEVFANWTQHPGRATNARFEVTHANGDSAVYVDQRSGGGLFQSLGIFEFNSGDSGTIRISTVGTDGTVVADAIRIVPVSVGGLPSRHFNEATSESLNDDFSVHDVTQDGIVSALDALQLINHLGTSEREALNDAEFARFDRLEQKWDVNGDGQVTALDALNVINELGKSRLPRYSEVKEGELTWDENLDLLQSDIPELF